MYLLLSVSSLACGWSLIYIRSLAGRVLELHDLGTVYHHQRGRSRVCMYCEPFSRDSEDPSVPSCVERIYFLIWWSYCLSIDALLDHSDVVT